MKLLIYIFSICLSLVSCSKRDTEKQVVEQIKLTCSGNLFQSSWILPYSGNTVDETKKGNKTYIFTRKKINNVTQWNLEEEGSTEKLILTNENLNESGQFKEKSSSFINDNEISITLSFFEKTSSKEDMTSHIRREIKINRINGSWYDNKVNEYYLPNSQDSIVYYFLNTGTCERVKDNKI